MLKILKRMKHEEIKKSFWNDVQNAISLTDNL